MLTAQQRRDEREECRVVTGVRRIYIYTGIYYAYSGLFEGRVTPVSQVGSGHGDRTRPVGN